MQVGGAGPGDRTMIDALAPALAALPEGLAGCGDGGAGRGRRHSRMTRAQVRDGQAYLSADKLAGFNDPGAEGVARLFEDLARG